MVDGLKYSETTAYFYIFMFYIGQSTKGMGQVKLAEDSL